MSDSLENRDDKPRSLEPLKVFVNENRMAVVCSGDVPEGGEAEAERIMRGRLVELGLPENEKLVEATQRLRAALASTRRLQEVPLLEGTPPQLPVDGQIFWAQNFFDTGFLVDPETGQINYRERSAQRSVAAGQLLATITQPIPGAPGVSVLGKRVEPRLPRPAPIRPGNNVAFREEELKFYALGGGQVRYQSEVLTVDDMVTIGGDVGLATGNIHHPGSLIIAGSIDSGMLVEAAGDIDVFGTIGDARVVSTGSLTVQGGITGGDSCVIRIAGDLHAKYIMHANIEAEGDVVAESEIVQSTIKTRGAVRVTAGRLVGGEITALQGLWTEQLGSEANQKILLRVGVDFKLKERMGDREHVLAEQTKRLEQITQRLAPFRARGAAIPPKLKDMVIGLLQEAKTLQESNHVLEAEIETIRAESRHLIKNEVFVRGKLFPDAHVHLHPQDLFLREPLSGPLRMYLRDTRIHVVRVRGDGRRRTDGQPESTAEEIL